MNSFTEPSFSIFLIIPSRLSYADGLLNLPTPGAMVLTTSTYVPTILKGMTLYPENPLKFDFIINSGQDNLQGEAFQVETGKLIKYFLASLTVPEEDWWVNFSPSCVGSIFLTKSLLDPCHILPYDGRSGAQVNKKYVFF